ncbi:MAG: putative metalloprotease CJM1_0395 family protein [Promethearchaeota archaeon]
MSPSFRTGIIQAGIALHGMLMSMRMARIEATLLGKQVGIIAKLRGINLAGMGIGRLTGGVVAAAGAHIGGKAVARGLGSEELGAVEALTGALGAAGATLAVTGNPLLAAIAAISSGFVSLTQSIIESNKQMKKTAKVLEKGKQKTAEFTRFARERAKEAVTPYEKVRAEVTKLEAQLSDLNDQVLAKKTGFWAFVFKPDTSELDERIEKIREQIRVTQTEASSLKIEPPEMADPKMDQRINDLLKQRVELMKKVAEGRGIAKEKIRIETLREQVNKLQQVRDLKAEETVITQKITQYQKAARTVESDERELQNIIDKTTELEKQLKKVHEQTIQLQIGIDESATQTVLTDLRKEFQDLSKQQVAVKLGEAELGPFLGSLKKAQDEYDRLKKAVKKFAPDNRAIRDTIEEVDQLAASLKDWEGKAGGATDEWKRFNEALGELSRFGPIFDGLTGSIDKLASLIDTLGPRAQAFGIAMSQAVQGASAVLMVTAFQEIDEAAEAVQLSLRQIEQATDREQAAAAYEQLNKALEESQKAAAGLQKSIEGALAPLEKTRQLVALTKDLRQLDLEISQQLYGTPALAVQAQLNLVQLMQREKEVLESQLATVRARHQEALAMGEPEENLIAFRQKELELSKQIRSITRDQLTQVKQLRDGYLDAIKAQALGAGKFSKIIITQEQNLMRGLQKGAVKRNYLLGQYAEDAAKRTADAYRFSAQGMGILETLGGQPMTGPEIARAVYERVANIADPLSKAAARDSAAIFMNIIEGANKNTQDLASIYMIGSNNIVDAINVLAEQRLPAGAAGLALGGGDLAAGITAVGSTAERIARGVEAPRDIGYEGLITTLKEMRATTADKDIVVEKVITDFEAQIGKPIQFDAQAYREFALAQGSAIGSIDALIDYLDRQRITTALPPAPRDKIDPMPANKFFNNALNYYERIITALDPEGRTQGITFNVIAPPKEAQPISTPGEPDITGLPGRPGEPRLSIGAVPGVSGISGISGVSGAPGVPGLSTSATTTLQEFRQYYTPPQGKTTLAQVPGDERSKKQLIRDYHRVDQEVKRHERAHKRAAGPFAEGGPTYEYEQGPDGRRYAVGGEVLVDITPVPGDPVATIAKMQRVQRAALAPRHPSEEDVAVAATAARIEKQMREKIITKRMAPVETGVPAIWIPTDQDIPQIDIPELPEVRMPKTSEIPKAPEVTKPETVEQKLPTPIHIPTPVKQEIPDVEEPAILGIPKTPVVEDISPKKQEPAILARPTPAGIKVTAPKQDIIDIQPSKQPEPAVLKRSFEYSLPQSLVVPKIDLSIGASEIVQQYEMLVKQLEAISNQLAQAKPGDEFDDLSRQFGEVQIELTKHVQSVVSSVEVEGIQAISDLSTSLVQPYLGQLKVELSNLGDLSLKIDTASSIDKNELVAELEKAKVRVGIRADVIRRTFGQTGVGVINKALAEFTENMARQAAAQITDYQKDIIVLLAQRNESIQIGADVSDFDKQIRNIKARIEDVRLDFNPEAVDKLVAESSKDLLDPYTEELERTFGKMADLTIQLDTADIDHAPILQKQLDEVTDNARKQAEQIQKAFGPMGFAAIDKSLAEFSSEMTDIAAKQVQEYQGNISRLEQIREDVTPQIQHEIDTQIQALKERVSDIKFDFGAERIEQAVTKIGEIKIDDSSISSKSREYADAVQHIAAIVGKEVDWGDMNLSEVAQVRKEAAATLAFYEKQAEQLRKSNQLTRKQETALYASRAIVDESQKREEAHQQKRLQLEHSKETLVRRQADLQAQVAAMILPIKDVETLSKLEEKRAATGAFTTEQLAEQVPQITEIAQKFRRATGRERDIGRPEREASRAELEGMLGSDWRKIAAEFHNVFRNLRGEGTFTPGAISRSTERLQAHLARPQVELSETQRELKEIRTQQKYLQLPAQEKVMTRALTPIIHVLGTTLGEAATRGLPGAIGAVIDRGESKRQAEDQKRLEAETDRVMEIARAGGVLQRSLSGVKHDPRLGGVSPLLYAVDTDSFTRKRGLEEEMVRQYGKDRGEPIARQAERVKGTERKIREEETKLKLRVDRDFEVGPKSLHGFEIPGVETDEKPPHRPFTRPGSKKRHKALKKLRDKQQERLQDLIEAAKTDRKREPTLTSDQQFIKMEMEQERVQKAATDALGITYSGKAPTRVPEIRRFIETGKDILPGLPTGTLPTISVPKAVPMPARPAKVGIGDPTRIRQLSHGTTGNWQTKGRGVKDILRQAGQVIEEMGSEMDRLNTDQGNITQYAGNRLFNVQPTTP